MGINTQTVIPKLIFEDADDGPLRPQSKSVESTGETEAEGHGATEEAAPNDSAVQPPEPRQTTLMRKMRKMMDEEFERIERDPALQME